MSGEAANQSVSQQTGVYSPQANPVAAQGGKGGAQEGYGPRATDFQPTTVNDGRYQRLLNQGYSPQANPVAAQGGKGGAQGGNAPPGFTSVINQQPALNAPAASQAPTWYSPRQGMDDYGNGPSASYGGASSSSDGLQGLAQGPLGRAVGTVANFFDPMTNNAPVQNGPTNGYANLGESVSGPAVSYGDPRSNAPGGNYGAYPGGGDRGGDSSGRDGNFGAGDYGDGTDR